MVLPVRLGGLGITYPFSQSTAQYAMSTRIHVPLNLLPSLYSNLYCTHQKPKQGSSEPKWEVPSAMWTSSCWWTHQATQQQPAEAMNLSMEKGASSWLSTLPVTDHRFTFHKGALCNATGLKYGWRPQHLPSYCMCGKQYIHGGPCTKLFQRRISNYPTRD